ncbi:MAG: hypothetical protein Q8P71_01290 [bacterium]|nr:hypothetical protein [bacterium]
MTLTNVKKLFLTLSVFAMVPVAVLAIETDVSTPVSNIDVIEIPISIDAETGVSGSEPGIEMIREKEGMMQTREEAQKMREQMLQEQRKEVEARQLQTNEVRAMQQERAIVPMQNFQEKREHLLQEQQEKKEEVLLRVRERTTQAREDVEGRMEMARQKAAEVLDERKAEQAVRLNEQINKLNENLSRRYFGHLNALELVLEKVESRIALIEEAKGTDLSNARLVVEEARDRVAEAIEAIAVQQAKIYVVEIESLEGARQSHQMAFAELRTDHADLRDRVLGATRNLMRGIMFQLKASVEE